MLRPLRHGARQTRAPAPLSRLDRRTGWARRSFLSCRKHYRSRFLFALQGFSQHSCYGILTLAVVRFATGGLAGLNAFSRSLAVSKTPISSAHKDDDDRFQYIPEPSLICNCTKKRRIPMRRLFSAIRSSRSCSKADKGDGASNAILCSCSGRNVMGAFKRNSILDISDRQSGVLLTADLWVSKALVPVPRLWNDFEFNSFLENTVLLECSACCAAGLLHKTNKLKFACYAPQCSAARQLGMPNDRTAENQGGMSRPIAQQLLSPEYCLSTFSLMLQAQNSRPQRERTRVLSLHCTACNKRAAPTYRHLYL